MRMIFEYGKEKVAANLSDSPKNARLALQMAYDIVGDREYKIFIPSPKVVAPVKNKVDHAKVWEKVKKEWLRNGKS